MQSPPTSITQQQCEKVWCPLPTPNPLGYQLQKGHDIRCITAQYLHQFTAVPNIPIKHDSNSTNSIQFNQIQFNTHPIQHYSNFKPHSNLKPHLLKLIYNTPPPGTPGSDGFRYRLLFRHPSHPWRIEWIPLKDWGSHLFVPASGG